MKYLVNFPCDCEEIDLPNFIVRFFVSERDDIPCYESWLFHKKFDFALFVVAVEFESTNMAEFQDYVMNGISQFIDEFYSIFKDLLY